MTRRVWNAAAWAAVGILLGAAVLAAGQEDEELVEQLAELEALSAKLRALESEDRQDLPPVTQRGYQFDRIYLTDLLSGIHDWFKPDRDPEEYALFFGAMSEEAPQAYGTSEELCELVRSLVRPEAWELASIVPAGPSLVLHAPPDLSAEARRFVQQELRPLAHRTVNLDVEILWAPDAHSGDLSAAVGLDLDPALRERLEMEPDTRLVFAGRLLGLSRQRVVLWHGAQVATVADADVEVAQESETSDPLTRIELTGLILQARSTPIGDSQRVRVELDLEYDLLERPVRTWATFESAYLQMAHTTLLRVRSDSVLKSGRWSVVAERATEGNGRHFVLVRPTLVDREGGAR